MPYPKLSAVLNNCPLHALTPEIKAEVMKYADNDAYRNRYTEEYQALKNQFATFYGFNPETFTWLHFASLLNSYNAFDTQIILGPVLRTYMKQSMLKNNMIEQIALVEDKTVPQLIEFYTEISPHTGRFYSLAPDELFSYVSKFLGFNIKYYPQNGSSQTFHIIEPISTIEVYHQGGIEGAQSGGHWERTLNGQLSEEVQTRGDTQLNHILPFLGQDPALNSYGLEFLKTHVQIKSRAVREGSDVSAEFSELQNTAQQIEDYLFNIAAVPKALAVDLLKHPLTANALIFIERHPFVEIPANQIYEQFISAPENKKPEIRDAEVEILARVLKYPERLQEIQKRNLEQLKALEAEFNAQHNQSAEQQRRSSPDASKATTEPESETQPAARPTTPEERKSPPSLSFRAPKTPTEDSSNTSISELEHSFDEKLQDLKTKVDEFKSRKNEDDKYNRAYKASKKLWKDLSTEKLTYFSGEQNAIRYKEFRENCFSHIKTARPELEKHRGLKEILGNLALAIVGLGIFYGLAIGINKLCNDRFLFFKTDSENKINDIVDHLNSSSLS